MHFYPHRCGGLNPLTMWKDFQRESQRLQMLRSYRAHCHRVRAYAERISQAWLFRRSRQSHSTSGGASGSGGRVLTFERTRGPGVTSADPPVTGAAYRLLFVGRMELLKGGQVLLDALPSVLAAVDRPLQMTFVGDGRERVRWEEKAASMERREPRLKVRFAGWLDGAPSSACSTTLICWSSQPVARAFWSGRTRGRPPWPPGRRL